MSDEPRYVKLGFTPDGWCCVHLWANGPAVAAGPIRLERGSELRPPRMVVEVIDVVLQELHKRLELPIIESPPLSEIEARVEGMSRRQDALEVKLTACQDALLRLDRAT